MGTARLLDDSPITAFHVKACCYTVGGFICDGYILGSIGLALPQIKTEMGLGSTWEGLLGASALIGIFAGSVVFGPITDRVGRKKMLLGDLVLFVIASVLQLFVAGPVALFALRFLLGVAIGADYAIAPTLLTEFAPRRYRGRLLSSLNATFTVGFVASYGIGILLDGRLGDDAWRWLLASSAIPGLLTLLLRLGTPESPRWLVSKGRADEARSIVDRYFGPEYALEEAPPKEQRTRYREVFSRRYRGRTFFAGMFWLCQVFPYFGIGTFLPRIVDAFGIENGSLGEVLFNLLLLAGAVAGWFVMDAISRRSFVIWSFVIVGSALLVLGLDPSLPAPVLIPVFLVVAFVISAAADLESVYPSEIFPTEVRASGTGLAAGISRVGAALSTFVLPSVLDGLGIGPTMLILAAVVFLGVVISVPLAPETRHVALHEASREAQPEDRGAEAQPAATARG
ncbi:MFS transporter [Streptomyces odontomachi]|uniref:MFS transporter n=1 Tax=Streptomyces odontomachi TaxID=2944940 RepID=UPI00210D92B0|nr:MFS transporter [Streptomyces sp. ODS25]